MNDIRVTGWNELLEQLYEDSWQNHLSRFRSNLAFRGMSDASYNLKTSVIRLEGDTAKLENHLLRNFKKYAQYDAEREPSIWNWLAVAQHHGLPTRLLDWTYSPLVAMHFATEDLDFYDTDGVIWCVDFVKTNQLLPRSLRKLLEEEGSNAFTVEMLTAIAGTLQEYDRLAKKEFVVFFEPPSLDERIINQFALFAMMSNPTARLDYWLETRPELSKRIIIPAALKWEVRDKLDQANITERVLLPGLDGLSRWLRRYYTTRTDKESKDDV